MSDSYFRCARQSGCIGIKQDMTGFHACAREANCKKNAKPKKRTYKDQDIVTPGLHMFRSIEKNIIVVIKMP